MAILSSPTDRTTGRATGTSSPHALLGHLRSSLDKPLASYHLVMASSGLLLALGMMMVLSASSYYAYVNTGDSYYFVKRQVIFLIVGLLTAWLVSRMSLSTLRMLGWVALFGSLVLLVLTYTPLGDDVNGNRNWVVLGHSLLRLQPSEFAKLAIVLWGADVLARKEHLLEQPKHLIIPYLPVTGILVLLVIFQGDLGTAMVMAGVILGVLFMMGAPMRLLAGLMALGGAGILAMVIISPNRMRRFTAFLNPTEDLLGVNMQATVGIQAIASGGWWGRGLGASRQKWGPLREAHTDFVFAVTAEELGLFGSLAVLVLFLVLGYAGIRIALRSDNSFCRHVASGVTAWFMFQALINLLVVLRLGPVMGVPLPLVSYGGSALLANLIALGLLLACARNEPDAREVLTGHRTRKVAPRVTTVVGGRS
ncbi:putative lipid II flippase FtsW [Propionibacteriaceae bacterium Y1685]|uniref:putative lipid II flippase FtsW n=1 Tax=Microlunatus sp. Y1700 TaxID=3418487 RepID=UPI003B7EE77C